MLYHPDLQRRVTSRYTSNSCCICGDPRGTISCKPSEGHMLRSTKECVVGGRGFRHLGTQWSSPCGVILRILCEILAMSSQKWNRAGACHDLMKMHRFYLSEEKMQCQRSGAKGPLEESICCWALAPIICFCGWSALWCFVIIFFVCWIKQLLSDWLVFCNKRRSFKSLAHFKARDQRTVMLLASAPSSSSSSLLSLLFYFSSSYRSFFYCLRLFSLLSQ